MRQIKYLVLHCTAGPQHQTTDAIKAYWVNVLGWKNPGYHFLINADGTIEQLLPIDQVSNGVAGFNSNSIHISYKGGVDAKGNAIDNRTPAQISAQIQLLKKFKKQFPSAEIKGHNEFPGVTKACPSFSVKKWLKTVDI